MTHTGFVKGMAIGVVAGATIGMIVTPKSKNAKRAAGRFLRTAGEVIESFGGMWH